MSWSSRSIVQQPDQDDEFFDVQKVHTQQLGHDHYIVNQLAVVLVDPMKDMTCVECRQPVGQDQRIVACILVEDPIEADSMATAALGLTDVLGPLQPTEMVPLPGEARYAVWVHQEECAKELRKKRRMQMLNRVTLCGPLRWEIEQSGRSTLSEYLCLHHSAKLDMVRGYPNCSRLTVEAISEDEWKDAPSGEDGSTTSSAADAIPTGMTLNEYLNAQTPCVLPVTGSSAEYRSVAVPRLDVPTTGDVTDRHSPMPDIHMNLPSASADNIWTSMVLRMPEVVAQHQALRRAAMTQPVFSGLFMEMHSVDITYRDTGKSTGRSQQLQWLSEAAHNAFDRDNFSSQVSASMFCHTLPNTNTNDVGLTTWRVVYRLDVHETTLKNRWQTFVDTFLHPDAMIPECMTWSQMFRDNVNDTIQFVQAQIQQNVFFQSHGRQFQRWEYINQWINNVRDANWALLRLAHERFIKAIKHTESITNERVTRITEQSGGDTAMSGRQFTLRVNAQEVVTRKTDQTKEYYYTMPLDARKLSWFTYDVTRAYSTTAMQSASSSALVRGMDASTAAASALALTTETQYVPITYVDHNRHNDLMRRLDMIEQPLENLQMLYYPSKSTVQQFNAQRNAAMIAQQQEQQMAAQGIPTTAQEQMAVDKQLQDVILLKKRQIEQQAADLLTDTAPSTLGSTVGEAVRRRPGAAAAAASAAIRLPPPSFSDAYH